MASVVISIARDVERFIFVACRMITYLFWQGIRMHQSFVNKQLQLHLDLSPAALKASEGSGVGKPSPLLAILGIDQKVLASQIDQTNKAIDVGSGKEPAIAMALVNGPRAFVCSGLPQHLYLLTQSLDKIRVKVALSVFSSSYQFSYRREIETGFV